MSPEHRRLIWVIGAGGLLGSEVVTAARTRGAEVFSPGPIRWADPADARHDLTRAAADFMARAEGREWQLAWCAGVGVTGTSTEQLDAEVSVFRATLDALTEHAADSRGAVFLASSAGGVYAGSSGAPFDEFSEPRPLAPYGHAKLALETLLRDWSTRTGANVLVGRIANLYGPGQDLSKSQGLISHVCKAQLRREPILIYVPLDTVRNYLFAPDCAQMVVVGLTSLQAQARTQPSQQWLKVMAGPDATSISFVLAELQRILKRKPLVVHGSSATSRFQASDLRLRSRVLPDLDQLAATSLPIGMKRTLDGLRVALNRGYLV